MKDKLKRAWEYTQNNPYKVGFYTVTGFAYVFGFGMLYYQRAAFKNAKTIDMANDIIENIAQAIENGLEMVVDRENMVIDVIPKALEAAAQD